MLEFLAQPREEHKDDDSTLTAIGEIENELNSKKYGFVWESHEETVDVKMQTHIPVFSEDTEKELTAVTDGDYNFLLEGDNLHSLYLLEKTHKGRIDVIYIDPPYNTGKKNDFRYRLPRKLPKHRLTCLFCAKRSVSPLHYTKQCCTRDAFSDTKYPA